jgi:SAM-dependent methyltransferase
MIALAKRNAPGGRFRVASLWSAPIPVAAGVVAIGEVLNYQFDGRVTLSKIRHLFKKIRNALKPSGVFIFDVLCETRSGPPVKTFSFREGKGWFVAVEKIDSPRQVIRRIYTFRRIGRTYVKSTEVHSAHRYDARKLRSALRAVRFKVTMLRGYGSLQFEYDHRVFVARKKS